MIFYLSLTLHRHSLTYGQILMDSPFPIKHQNINKFLHLSQYLKSIAEMVYDELCRHLKHQKSPISKFIIISSKQFFLFSLSPSYGIIGNISPQSEIELIVNQWRSQKQQPLVFSSCLQKHTSEGNSVHQLIVANHSTYITQNCEHSILFFFQTCEKIRKVKKKNTTRNFEINTDKSNLLAIAVLVYNDGSFRLNVKSKA